MIPESLVVLFGREMLLTCHSVGGRQPIICEEGRLHTHAQPCASVDHYGVLAQT